MRWINKSVVFSLLAVVCNVSAQSTTTTSAVAQTSAGRTSSLTTSTTALSTPLNNVTTTTPGADPTSLSPAAPTDGIVADPTAESVDEGPRKAFSVKLDPAMGVLGGLLIITGLPTAFIGSKNKWTSSFIVGVYTTSIIIAIIIINVAVAGSSKPTTAALRGGYLVACVASGLVVGAVTVIWWKGARYLIGAIGGFFTAWYFLAFRNNGLIRQIGTRYALFLPFTAIGFVSCVVPFSRAAALLLSTAAIGATATVLGIDCFTAAGLKEFYVYLLGFGSTFPEGAAPFDLSTGMMIELGGIGLITICGAAWQFKCYDYIRAKTREKADADEDDDAFGPVGTKAGFVLGNDSSSFAQGTAKTIEKWEAKFSENSAATLVQHHTDSESSIAMFHSPIEPSGSVAALLPEKTRSAVPGSAQPQSQAINRAAVRPAQSSKTGRNASSVALLPMTGSATAPPSRPGSVVNLTRPNSFASNLDGLTKQTSSPRHRQVSQLTIDSMRPRSMMMAPDDRRHTMIDLIPDNLPSFGEKARRNRDSGIFNDRILLADPLPLRQAPPPMVVPKVMNYSTLQEKHRRRISQIQASASELELGFLKTPDKVGTRERTTSKSTLPSIGSRPTSVLVANPQQQPPKGDQSAAKKPPKNSWLDY